MRIGVAHHLGWAVVVAASAEHAVVDRRRIELIEPGLPAAPIHHEANPVHNGGRELDDADVAALVAAVRGSAHRATAAALDRLAADLPGPVLSLSLRSWPADFPVDIAVLRRPPYEARADSVMYLQILEACAGARGWDVHRFDARHVEAESAVVLGARAADVLHGPRATLGPPWTRDHRVALAATILAG